MKILLGIGNPGFRYKNNRHNAGFLFLDFYAKSKAISYKAGKGDYYSAEGVLEEERFCLIKPVVFVNNSGIAAKQALDFYHSNVNDLLVIVDDINLPFPAFRVRKSGGDGGHNGMKSIICHLESDQFPRIRIGIRTIDVDTIFLSDFVLTDFTRTEKITLKSTFNKITVLADEFIRGGVEAMMNENSRLHQNEIKNNPKGNQE
ncbi:MAG: aminoacyl-tRNA hydrolase [Ignavibacteriaceae bacterium]